MASYGKQKITCYTQQIFPRPVARSSCAVDYKARENLVFDDFDGERGGGGRGGGRRVRRVQEVILVCR